MLLIVFCTIVSCSESPKRPFKEDESLQNISDGFFEKNAVLADEVIEHLIEDLDVSAMKTNEYQLTSQDKSPCTVYSRSVTPVHPQSDIQINCENCNIDNRDSPSKLSDTPTPSEYNSFTSSPPRPLSELDQNICLLNSGRPSSTSLSNCQSYTRDTSDASSAVEASSECSTPSSLNGRKRRQFSIDRTKKRRLRNKDKWIDTRRKLLLNSGKQHQSRNGKLQPAKHLKPACGICKFNCSAKISHEDRKLIFNRFWDLCDHEKQWVFIGKYTKRCMKRRITTENDSKRQYSVNYTLPTNVKEASPKTIKVCKTMFKNTLSVSNQFIQSALDKYDKNTGSCEKDFRGHHNNKNKVCTAAIIKGVCDHVNSFQPAESHYTRKDTNKVYLADLNFSTMFKLYQTWAEENNIVERVRTARQYRDIVNKEMNIAFYIPKKDQCHVCIAFKNCLLSPTTQRDKYNKHIQDKNIARSLKKQDKNEAVSKPETVTSATFDFQKILSTPHGETSSFYYKRKLSVFNFTVFDLGLKKGICYMWPETIAKRGSNEVASCLYNFIQQSTNRGIKDIHLWSDNCGGQNRNRIVFLMYVYCSQKYSIDICHRFLEKGHTQQEGDSVHALIEKSSKRKFIFCPEEWYTLVRWCKTSGDAYEVIEITQDQILDFKMCLNDFKLTKNTDNENVKWNQVREIVVKAENPYAIFYKYDLNDEEPKRIDLVRKVTTRSHRSLNDPKKCYDEPIMITSAKYKDLISLCQQNLIPPRYHNFYKNLKHSSYTDGNETE